MEAKLSLGRQGWDTIAQAGTLQRGGNASESENAFRVGCEIQNRNGICLRRGLLSAATAMYYFRIWPTPSCQASAGSPGFYHDDGNIERPSRIPAIAARSKNI
jgi:hypothetical protein